MTQAELLARQLDDTRAWTVKLIEDLRGDDWHFQPAPGLAHPLWLCGHLACAEDLLVNVRCLGNRSQLPEEFTGHFPIGGPIASSAEYEYPDAGVVRKRMDEVHRMTLEAIREMSDTVLAEAAYGKDGQPHPHYTDKAGAVCHCSRHEGFHAGQLAMIRRLLGKPFLR